MLSTPLSLASNRERATNAWAWARFGRYQVGDIPVRCAVQANRSAISETARAAPASLARAQRHRRARRRGRRLPTGDGPGAGSRLCVVGDAREALPQLDDGRQPPSLWKAARIAAASASVTTNMAGAWTMRPWSASRAWMKPAPPRCVVRPSSGPSAKVTGPAVRVATKEMQLTPSIGRSDGLRRARPARPPWR